VKYSEVE